MHRFIGATLLILALVVSYGLAQAEDEHLYRAAMMYGHNGTEWEKAQLDSNGNLKIVNGSGSGYWIAEGRGAAGTPSGGVMTVQGASSMTALKVDGSAVTQPVSIATMPSTPVTGNFWQDTQPVSIASMPTTPVTGTFYPDTQPISGTVSTDLNPASSVLSGQKDVETAGTELVIAESAAILSVTVKAKHTNTGYIYVGPSGVSSTTGYILSKDEAVTVDADNLADVYVDCSVNGEGISYIAVVK